MNVEISDFIKAELEGIKEGEGHKSLDSVVRSLLAQRRERGRQEQALVEKYGLGIEEKGEKI